MKRSEMIRAIKQRLDNTVCNEEDYADQFLTVVEQLGMLPPTLRYDSVNEYVSIKDTDILRDNDASFAWEPEDGTNA
jgi:hypothetical protein